MSTTDEEHDPDVQRVVRSERIGVTGTSPWTPPQPGLITIPEMDGDSNDFSVDLELFYNPEKRERYMEKRRQQLEPSETTPLEVTPSSFKFQERRADCPIDGCDCAPAPKNIDVDGYSATVEQLSFCIEYRKEYGSGSMTDLNHFYHYHKPEAQALIQRNEDRKTHMTQTQILFEKYKQHQLMTQDIQARIARIKNYEVKYGTEFEQQRDSIEQSTGKRLSEIESALNNSNNSNNRKQ